MTILSFFLTATFVHANLQNEDNEVISAKQSELQHALAESFDLSTNLIKQSAFVQDSEDGEEGVSFSALGDHDANNQSARGISCKWQSDCPTFSACCNKPNGGHGYCWFGGSCDIYCDTDANCSGLGGGAECIDGKCGSHSPETQHESKNEVQGEENQNSHYEHHDQSDGQEANSNNQSGRGFSCQWQSDCSNVLTCCNKPNGGHGTCWWEGNCRPYCDTDAHCKGFADSAICKKGRCVAPFGGETAHEQNVHI